MEKAQLSLDFFDSLKQIPERVSAFLAEDEGFEFAKESPLVAK